MATNDIDNFKTMKNAALRKSVLGLLEPSKFGGERMTLEETAALLSAKPGDVSRGSVFRDEHLALEKMKDSLVHMGIRSFADAFEA